MSRYRVTLVALATLFTGVTSAAFADCCGWGTPAPAAYASYRCGGCAAAFAPAYAQAPVAGWGTGCGCGGGCGCAQSVAYVAPPVMEPQIAPAPIYVVDQGPDYSGPGIMIPYRTWSPAVPAAIDYPYFSGGYGRPYYHGPRYAYGARFYGHPRWWRYPHHPLGVRD
jgi:hypothetical protein